MSLTSLHVKEKVNKAENSADAVHVALIKQIMKLNQKISCF
ncbi:hypothetical protein F385_3379 [Pantoea agglomerans 299R]|nr:hypothetical protein F385_3379 [Pantoea agglomerans 299R]